jgi:ABC transporter substrate binding protein
MFATQNRADNVRRQYRETEEPRRVGRNDAFGFGNILKRQASICEKQAESRCHSYAQHSIVAAKQATSIIPIVFATAADPVGTGVVASLAQPGGNVTGLSSQTTDLAGLLPIVQRP